VRIKEWWRAVTPSNAPCCFKSTPHILNSWGCSCFRFGIRPKQTLNCFVGRLSRARTQSREIATVHALWEASVLLLESIGFVYNLPRPVNYIKTMSSTATIHPAVSQLVGDGNHSQKPRSIHCGSSWNCHCCFIQQQPIYCRTIVGSSNCSRLLDVFTHTHAFTQRVTIPSTTQRYQDRTACRKHDLLLPPIRTKKAAIRALGIPT